MKSRLKAWLSAARLRTLPLSLAGIFLGNGLAFSQASFNYSIFFLACCTTIAFQVLSNFANDYGDGVKGTDNASRIGPARAVQQGILSQKEMKAGIVVTSILALAFAILLIGISFSSQQWLEITLFFLLGIASIVAAITYTVGKNAYGYYALGDLFVFLFFGGLSVIGSYYLQVQSLSFDLIFPAITMGALSTAVLNLNNMRDCENDKKMHKITLPVLLGSMRAKRYHFGLLSISFLSALFYPYHMGHPMNAYLFLIVFFPLLLHIQRVNKITHYKDFDPELKKVALLTFTLALFWATNTIYIA